MGWGLSRCVYVLLLVCWLFVVIARPSCVLAVYEFLGRSVCWIIWVSGVFMSCMFCSVIWVIRGGWGFCCDRSAVLVACLFGV